MQSELIGFVLVCGRGRGASMAFLVRATLFKCLSALCYANWDWHALQSSVNSKAMLLWALKASRRMTELSTLTALLMMIEKKKAVESRYWSLLSWREVWGGGSVGNWTIWSVDGWEEKASLTFMLFVCVWSVSCPQQSSELASQTGVPPKSLQAQRKLRAQLEKAIESKGMEDQRAKDRGKKGKL